MCTVKYRVNPNTIRDLQRSFGGILLGVQNDAIHTTLGQLRLVSVLGAPGGSIWPDL